LNLEIHKRELGKCTYCPKLCRFCCPTAEVENKETVTPWAKMSLAEMVRLGHLEVTADVGEVFTHCFACLHCRTHCTHGNNVPAALVQARAGALALGLEPEAVTAVLGRFRGTGNAYGENLHSALRGQLPDEVFVPEAKAVVYAGCEAIRSDASVLRRVFELLPRLGVDYVAIHEGKELCCGAPLWQAGDLTAFRQHAESVRSQLSSARTVICPCPTCAYVLRGLYAEMDLAPGAKVLHLTEFLHGVIRDRVPAKRVAGVHAFQDPCYLSRYLEGAELVRELLSAVLEQPLRESTWTGQDAVCCGGGGLVPHVLPEVASRAARMRMDQLEATGADRVITACPGCLSRLGQEASTTGVVDLVEILLQAY
jgi:Fe-S oxidoreductase